MLRRALSWVLTILIIVLTIGVFILPWLLLGPSTFWQRLVMGIVYIPWFFIFCATFVQWVTVQLLEKVERLYIRGKRWL
jgi:hypothetical protein